MMKAIFIPSYNKIDFTILNNELKDCTNIVKEISVDGGTILIIDVVTRKEKLEKLNKIDND